MSQASKGLSCNGDSTAFLQTLFKGGDYLSITILITIINQPKTQFPPLFMENRVLVHCITSDEIGSLEKGTKAIYSSTCEVLIRVRFRSEIFV